MGFDPTGKKLHLIAHIIETSGPMIGKIMTDFDAVSPLSYRTLLMAVSDNCIPLLIQQNTRNGSSIFRRGWNVYKVGFNDSDGNFWIGNEILHQLTMSGGFRLRVDLQSANSPTLQYWAEYGSIVVAGEEADYRLKVTQFMGNTGTDALAHHNHMKFTTVDRDNDYNGFGNCAGRSFHGGFWFRNCYQCCLTCQGQNFEWAGLRGGQQLTTSRMWLMCKY